jgi:general secretion pathway protein N
VRLALLVLVLGVPASTLALPTNADDIDLDAPRRADAPSTPSLWDQPAPPPPTLVRPPTPAPQQTDKRTPSANPLWAIPLAALSNTRARPIFSSSRRPPPAAAVPVPVAKASPPPPRVERPQLSLVGTVVGDDVRFGVFIDPATQAALRLKIGDDFQGWKLRSVQGREVTLTHDEQTATLSLPQPDAAKPTEPARADNASTQHGADNTPARRARR